MDKLVRELALEELILTALCMLIGEEGTDYCYYEEDKDWWALRLYINRN